MDEIKRIYENLSGVDIEEQFYQENERAKGYIGEYGVLKELLKEVNGTFKLLMNLKVPIGNRETEIDLLMIHETGIYVFEVKNYKGVIYGGIHQKRWTQYFRTVQNQTFYNPVLQNEYHLKALRGLGMNQPFYSMIVFTNQSCQLRIEGSQPHVEVLSISTLVEHLNDVMNQRKKILDLAEVDRLFQLLKQFTVIKGPLDVYESQEKLTLPELMTKLQLDIKTEQDVNRKQLKKIKRSYRTKLIGGLATMMGIVTFISFGIVSQSQEEKELALKQLHEMSLKYELMDPNRLPDFSIPLQLSVPTISLVPHELEEQAYHLSFDLLNESSYQVSLTEQSSILVMQQDGQLKEYSLYNENRLYNPYFSGLYQNQITQLGPYDLLGLSDEVEWIKLSNLKVSTTENDQSKVITTDYEVILYNQTP